MKKHKDILWGIGIMATVVAILILFALGNNNQNKSVLSTSVASVEWTKGNTESSVILVEYSDFQCPACGSYFPLVKKLMQEFDDRIKFSYRNFPLRQIHRNAEPAARAAEAAGKQGKFWEMHDLLFENQNEWSESMNAKSKFESYASQLGLNMDQFKTDRDSKEVGEKINKDYQSGVASRVNGTPTFFLNGKKIDNPRSYDQFKTIIIQALDAKP